MLWVVYRWVASRRSSIPLLQVIGDLWESLWEYSGNYPPVNHSPVDDLKATPATTIMPVLCRVAVLLRAVARRLEQCAPEDLEGCSGGDRYRAALSAVVFSSRK